MTRGDDHHEAQAILDELLGEGRIAGDARGNGAAEGKAHGCRDGRVIDPFTAVYTDGRRRAKLTAKVMRVDRAAGPELHLVSVARCARAVGGSTR